MKLIIFLSLVILLFISACSNDELDRSTASDLLQKEFEQSLESGCILNSVLANKPEFSLLKDKPICEAKYTVTGIRRVSETSAVVEAKKVFYAISPETQEFLDAFNALENRLLTIRGRKYYSWEYLGQIWEFIDETDGQKFTVRVFKGQTIKKTKNWENIQQIKKGIETMLRDGKLENNPTQFTFQLYDDGWRISNIPRNN